MALLLKGTKLLGRDIVRPAEVIMIDTQGMAGKAQTENERRM